MKRPGYQTTGVQRAQFTAFVPYGGNPGTEWTVAQLAGSGMVGRSTFSPGEHTCHFQRLLPPPCAVARRGLDNEEDRGEDHNAVRPPGSP